MLALLKNTTISIYGFLAYFLIGCQKLMQIRSNRKFPRFVEDGGILEEITLILFLVLEKVEITL
jgi:hypothetical protein